jgi:hypothetical protein
MRVRAISRSAWRPIGKLDCVFSWQVGVEETDDPGKMLQAVREPLLSIVRQDQDFSPEYDPLLVLAWRLARTDPRAAQELLTQLKQANPQRQNAKKMRVPWRNG